MVFNRLQLDQKIDVVVKNTPESLQSLSLVELHQIAENWILDYQYQDKAAIAKQLERATKQTFKPSISKRTQHRAFKKSSCNRLTGRTERSL